MLDTGRQKLPRKRSKLIVQKNRVVSFRDKGGPSDPIQRYYNCTGYDDGGKRSLQELLESKNKIVGNYVPYGDD